RGATKALTITPSARPAHRETGKPRRAMLKPTRRPRLLQMRYIAKPGRALSTAQGVVLRGVLVLRFVFSPRVMVDVVGDVALVVRASRRFWVPGPLVGHRLWRKEAAALRKKRSCKARGQRSGRRTCAVPPPAAEHLAACPAVGSAKALGILARLCHLLR